MLLYSLPNCKNPSALGISVYVCPPRYNEVADTAPLNEPSAAVNLPPNVPVAAQSVPLK